MEQLTAAQFRANHTKPTRPHTSGKILIGFDADTEACGLVLYDPAKNEVLKYELIESIYIREWLGDCIREHGAQNLFARVEMPTATTAYGATLRRGIALKAAGKHGVNLEKPLFQMVYNSGRCSEIARQFVHLLRSYGIAFEEVESERRTNIKNNANLAGLDASALLLNFRNKARFGHAALYPSKVSADFVKLAFPVKVAGTEEQRDALMLLLPERLAALKQLP